MLMMSTLARLRSRVVEAALNRRMKVFMDAREKSDAMAWGEMKEALARSQVRRIEGDPLHQRTSTLRVLTERVN